jgi:hypothetical protein
MVANASTTVTVDLIDEIVVIAVPTLAMMIGIDVIIAAIIAATAGTMTTGVIVVIITITTDATTDEMIHAMTDIAWTTTTARTIIRRNGLHHHRPKGATLMAHSRRPTARSTSSSAVTKRSKATDRPDQTPRRSGTSTLKTYDLYVGLNS